MVVRDLLLGSSLVALSTPALAQVAPGNSPNTTESQQPQGDGAIQDIVVTANKTASSAQSTPIALRVVGGEALRNAGVSDINGLQRLAPDLGITTDTIYTKLALRGVTAESIAEGADAALTVNIDGEYINRPVALNASFFDLDRIEVLKGPQGTLYGRNSTAGAINVITAKPTDKFEGYLNGGYGNFDAWQVQGAINIPIADGLAVRVAGLHTQHKGYRDNGLAGRGDDANVSGGRATIAYDGDRLKAFLQGEYINVDQDAPAQYGILVTAPSAGNPGTPGLVALPVPGGGVDYLPINSQFVQQKRSFPLQETGYFRSRQYHVRGQIDYALTDRLHATYSGGYLDNRYIARIPLTGVTNTLQFVTVPANDQYSGVQDLSNEFRLSYKGERGLLIQGGVFYFHEKQYVNNSIYITNPPFGPPGTTTVYANAFYRPGVYLDSIAGFLQGDLPITDTLKLTGGVRYTRDRKRGTYYNSGLGFIDPAFGLTFPTVATIKAGVGTMPGACQSASANNFAILNQCYGPKGEVSWLGGVDWTPQPGHLVYAKVSTGFRSGGFDNLTSQVVNGQAVGVFQPEKITAYEVGVKNRFFDNTVQFNLSAFHYDYRNLQVDNFINTTVGAATVNAGKARFNGVDTDLSVALSPIDRVTATFNYLDAKYTQFVGFATGVNGGTPARNLAGNRPPQAPKVTIGIGYDHSFDLGSSGVVKASAFSRFKSAYFLTSFNYRGDRQEAYTQTDLSLTYTTRNKVISVQAYVHNVEDYIPAVYASFVGGLPVTPFNYIYGAPRTFGVSGTFNF